MTHPSPGDLAAIDQLRAATRAAASQLTGHAEVWPDVGPATGTILASMFVAVAARFADGEKITCDHLEGAFEFGVWFPWAATRWWCPSCALYLASALAPTATCDACGTTTSTPADLALWSVGIAPRVTVGDRDGHPFSQISWPIVAKILLCPACHQRNREGKQHGAPRSTPGPVTTGAGPDNEGATNNEGGQLDEGGDTDPGDANSPGR